MMYRFNEFGKLRGAVLLQTGHDAVCFRCFYEWNTGRAAFTDDSWAGRALFALHETSGQISMSGKSI